MKTSIALLSLVVGLSAHAQMPDQFTKVMQCQPAKAVMDLGVSVTVQKGGFAGLTEVIVKRFFLGHTSSTTYIVNELPQNPTHMGAGLSYVGEGIELNTNFTTAQLPDGGHYAQLITEDANNSPSTENLSCILL